MTCKHIVLAFFALYVLSGCMTKDQFLCNIYEGMQNREKMASSNEPVPPPHPSYDQYKREREKILNKDKVERN